MKFFHSLHIWSARLLGAQISIKYTYLLKFGLPEKHTKFEKNLPRGFDKSADLHSKRQNQIMCASQKVLTLPRTIELEC